MDKKKINLYWYKRNGLGNFGDDLSSWIIQKLSDKKIKYVPLLEIENSKVRAVKTIIKKILLGQYGIADCKNFFEWIPVFNKEVLVSVGSIISWYRYKNVIVWGSGLMNEEDFIHPAKFIAVRGKYTCERILELGYDAPKVLGDPALLLDLIDNTVIEKKYKLGVIPHIVHHDYLKTRLMDQNILLINVLDGVDKVLDQIRSCEFTVTTSLHGLIVSHVYNVPSLWVEIIECDAKLNGDNIKFRDYMSSVELIEYKAKRISTEELKNYAGLIGMMSSSLSELLLPKREIIEKIQKELISSAPFPVKKKYFEITMQDV